MTDIPLSQPDIGELEIAEVTAVLRGSRLSLGPKMEEFEQQVSTLVGVSYATAVSSGTAGLHLCLVAMGIGSGDEVLLPSFTFIAAANAVRYVGATPVFADIDADSLNVDPDQIEGLITPATRLVLVVHTFGRAAEMKALLAVARKHRLLVLEDACEAIGATYQDIPVGSFGDAAVFAFYPNKQITTGEGGVIVTRHEQLAKEVKALRNQGRYDTDSWHQHSILGYNYRMPEISAALGCAQMQRLSSLLEARTRVATMYDTTLRAHPDFVLPLLHPPNCLPSWFVYVVRIPLHCTASGRDNIVALMRQRGIHCGRYFAPIHSQPAYLAWNGLANLPVTERESKRTIALPFFTTLSMAAVQRVVSTLVTCIDLVMTM